MSRPDAFELMLDLRAVASDLGAALLHLMNPDGTSAADARHEAGEALGFLLPAVKLALEIAGFDPDESERGDLYRAIVEYIGEEG